MTNATLAIGKVFTTGRSQAVRLPKAFRFDTAEVTIERVGDAVVLRPKLSDGDWWAEVSEALNGFEGMDFIERDHTLDKDDILSLDDPLPPSA